MWTRRSQRQSWGSALTPHTAFSQWICNRLIFLNLLQGRVLRRWWWKCLVWSSICKTGVLILLKICCFSFTKCRVETFNKHWLRHCVGKMKFELYASKKKGGAARKKQQQRNKAFKSGFQWKQNVKHNKHNQHVLNIATYSVPPLCIPVSTKSHSCCCYSPNYQITTGNLQISLTVSGMSVFCLKKLSYSSYKDLLYRGHRPGQQKPINCQKEGKIICRR